MKTSELTGAALDWAVAKCEGYPVSMSKTGFLIFSDPLIQCGPKGTQYAPSTNWSQGGPIIDKEAIAIRKDSKGVWYAMLSSDLGDGEGARWSKFTFKNVPKSASTSRTCRFTGNAPLIAAMRCYVASKLGDEVDVPEELSK